MSKIYFTFLLVYLTVNVYSQNEYYIVHNGKKEYLTPDKSKIIIKYKENYNSSSAEKIVSLIFDDYIIKSSNFDNNTVIIDLNKNTSEDKLENLRELNNVEYAGFGFTKGDRVIHYPSNEIIVRFKSAYGKSVVNNLNKLFKTEIKEEVKLFSDVYLLKSSGNGSETLDNAFDISNKYLASGLVEYAHPNFIRSNMLLYMPNDSLIDSMWHVKNTGVNIPNNVIGVPGNDLNLEPAWDVTTGDPNVLIAIIDTGCDTGHVDLIPNYCDRSLWWDFYSNDPIPMDEYSHGTPMAGIAAAKGDNFIGTAGVAFNCSILPIRVFGPWPTAFTTDLILGKGLQYSWLKGASVLSNSWGGGLPTQIISNAIDNARRFGRSGKGSVVVAGSGNDNNDTVYYPASYPGVIGVGGISPCLERKSPASCDGEGWGANYGEGLSVVAPLPFVGATLVLGGWCICATGTSSATPEVSGLAGLLISKNINISGDSVKMAIERTAHRVGNYSYNENKENGAWNFEMGYGRPDAKLALDFIPSGPSAISELLPPEIDMTPPESKLYNETITVEAEIKDNSGIAAGEYSPRLYYQRSGSNVYEYITGSLVNNKYSFTLPVIAKGEYIYYYVAAQDISPNPNVMTYPWGGKGINPPGYKAPEKKLYLTNSSYHEQVFNSEFQSIGIPWNETTIVASVNVPVNKKILDLDCILNITHEYTEDIVISLISPQGTEVILSANMGKNGDNYYDTRFDDEASDDIQDTNHHPPYTGSFKAIERLWLFDGESAFGEWKVKIVDNVEPSGGSFNNFTLVFRFSDMDNSIPEKFALLGNYPNPFNPSTTIRFDVKEQSQVRIILYDITGKQVAVIMDENRLPGADQRVFFNSMLLNGGRGMASGVYFYTMTVNNNYIDTRRLVLLK